MHFITDQTAVLSTQDLASLTNAIAAIPGVLTPLSTAISMAQTTGARAINLTAQMAALESSRASFIAGGGSPEGPDVKSFTAQKIALVNPLMVAEQQAIDVKHALFVACQACNPVLIQLHALAQTQLSALTEANLLAVSPTLYRANTPELHAAARNTPASLAMSGVFKRATLTEPTTLVETLTIATGLQTLLTAIEGGNDFLTLS